MRSTLFKTAVAATVGLSVAACSDSLAPTEAEGPMLESLAAVSGQAAPGARSPRFTGPFSGTLTIGPNNWTWRLEQNGNVVTGTVDPAPMLPGTLEGTVNDGVLDLVITYPSGATNVGQVSFDSPPRTFSGDLKLLAPNGFELMQFSTVMSRGNRPVGGNGPAAVAAKDVGISSKYNADGTLRANTPQVD